MIATPLPGALSALMVQAAATALTALGMPAPAGNDASLAGTTWAGQCAPVAIGTYTFGFGRSEVHIDYPGTREPRSVTYTVTGDASRGAVLSMATKPVWHGSFTVDRRILDWVFQVGDTTGYGHCHLVRLHPAPTP